ncbi:MAG TPA: serine--tRNA ligase [Candidatus Paceibacterota bacterium]|nr:serine--tRNA ligase [Candidatus Paceibacterota bacterium]
MLDIHFIRENVDLVKEGARKKRVEIDIDRLLAVDDQRRALRQELDEKRAEQNRASDRISLAKGDERTKLIEAMQQLKSGMTEIEEKFKAASEEWTKLMLAVPNIPSPDTPEGPDESGNKVVREWGTPTKFDFTPKPHWDLGKELDLIDTEKAGEVSGARFSYLKGDLALMQFALIMFALKTITTKEGLQNVIEEAKLDIDPKPFTAVIPPVMVRTEVMGRMARLHPMDERYLLEKDDLVLVGSAEHTLGPIHMGEILEEESLPRRYVGYSTAFRREAGAAGKDTRGILRQHQFDKLEMESFSKPEDGYREQELFVAIQEYLMRALKLPHRTMIICTGDMGKPDQRQFDIETWMPGQDTYRETHTADYMGGYQARRLNTRVKSASGDLSPVHMNDATAFAIGRTLIAIMENYQQADGTIKVPDVLVPYVGKKVLGHSA